MVQHYSLPFNGYPRKDEASLAGQASLFFRFSESFQSEGPSAHFEKKNTTGPISVPKSHHFPSDSDPKM